VLQLGESRFRDRIGRIDRQQAVFLGFEKGKSSQSEEGVKDIDSVSGSIADSAFFWILAVQNEEF
jgi:hypothetical protein